MELYAFLLMVSEFEKNEGYAPRRGGIEPRLYVEYRREELSES